MNVLSSPTTFVSTTLRLGVLSTLPMLGAVAGALVDERSRFGVSTWTSACRAEGVSLRSIFAFTLELLPCAIIGGLLAGLVLLAIAFCGGARAAQCGLVAHAGCAIAMPVGLILCALALPLPLMLAIEGMLGGVVAFCLLAVLLRQKWAAITVTRT